MSAESGEVEFGRQRPGLRQLGPGVDRSRQALGKRFERIRERSGLKKLCYAHALRASFATKMAEEGVSAPSLAYVMGWVGLEAAESYVQSSMKRAHAEQWKILNLA